MSAPSSAMGRAVCERTPAVMSGNCSTVNLSLKLPGWSLCRSRQSPGIARVSAAENIRSEGAPIKGQARSAAELIESAVGLGPVIRACRGEIEACRRLPAALLAAMHEARLFKMYVPAELGGLETDPVTSMRVVEAIAEEDGAAAWALMIGSTYGIPPPRYRALASASQPAKSESASGMAADGEAGRQIFP
jgi:Acyl-CoA dehydrogenase, N-terminal domain